MAAPYVFDKHDFGILRQDATTKVGLQLVQKNGVPQYGEYDDEFLANQFFTGVPGYANLPIEKEIVLRQDDWRAGFGLEFFDSDEPSRYRFSSMDLRHRGMAILSNKATNSIAIPSHTDTCPTIVNADMELITGWSPGSRSNIYFRNGAYSWEVLAAQPALQSLAWNNNLRGRTFTFTCWVYQPATASSATISIDDGTKSTSGTDATVGSWFQLSIAKTLAQGATQLRLELNTSATNYFDDAVITMTTGDGFVIRKAEFNSLLFVSFGNILAKLNATGDGFTEVYRFPYNIVDLEPFTDDNLYIATGSPSKYWYMAIAETVTQSTLADGFADFFQAVGTTMFKALLPRELKSATNPTNAGAWGGITSVDSSSYDIEGMLSFDNLLYIMKGDRPFYRDSVGVIKTLTNITKTMFSTTAANGKNPYEWQGKVYMAYGEQGLLEYDNGTFTWRSPSEFCTEVPEMVGKILGIASDEQYLYIVTYEATYLYISAGRLETIGDTTQWVWHPIQFIPVADITNCEVAFTSSVFQKRLWVASTVSTKNIFYMKLPTGYGNIVNDANADFLTGAGFQTSWLHGNFKDDTKAYIKLTMTLGHAYDVDIYFAVWYQKKGDATWTAIGSFKGTATNRVVSAFIPADATPTNPISPYIRFLIKGYTNNTAKTPILLSYKVQSVLYPTNRRIIACQVRCSNEVVLKDGTIDKGSAATIKATLDEARAATWPVTIYDIDGITRTVKFLPAPTGLFSIEKDEKGRVQERVYNLLMQCIDLS